MVADEVLRADSGSGGGEIDRNPNELSRAVERADISMGLSSSSALRIELDFSGAGGASALLGSLTSISPSAPSVTPADGTAVAFPAASGSGGGEIDRNPNELSRAVERADISTSFRSSAALRIEVDFSGAGGASALLGSLTSTSPNAPNVKPTDGTGVLAAHRRCLARSPPPVLTPPMSRQPMARGCWRCIGVAGSLTSTSPNAPNVTPTDGTGGAGGASALLGSLTSTSPNAPNVTPTDGTGGAGGAHRRCLARSPRSPNAPNVTPTDGTGVLAVHRRCLARSLHQS